MYRSGDFQMPRVNPMQGLVMTSSPITPGETDLPFSSRISVPQPGTGPLKLPGLSG
jgi:hypothetical protein